MKKKPHEIRDYDASETTAWIDRSKRRSLRSLGFALPPQPPTQVVSIRLPTYLLNQLRACASTRDVPYQALIKLLLLRGLRHAEAM